MAQPCISTYRLSLGSGEEETAVDMAGTLEHTFTGLEPCTDYTLSILPLMGEEALAWEGGPLLVKHLNGV